MGGSQKDGTGEEVGGMGLEMRWEEAKRMGLGMRWEEAKGIEEVGGSTTKGYHTSHP